MKMTPQEELQITYDDVINDGHTILSKEELANLIVGKTVYGNYEYNGHRKFVSYIDPDGSVNGTNDWGSYEEGEWSIGDDHIFTVSWDGYWEDWSAYAFHIDGEVKFYEQLTGQWKTTFDAIKDGDLPLELLQ